MAELKDANTNPWYVLMTLYGEQTGDEIETEVHKENRQLWNTFVQQFGGTASERAREVIVGLPSRDAWRTQHGEILKRLKQEYQIRNGSLIPDGFDWASWPCDLTRHSFKNSVILNGFFMPKGAIFDGSNFAKGISSQTAYWDGRLSLVGCSNSAGVDLQGSVLVDGVSCRGARIKNSVQLSDTKLGGELILNRVQVAGSLIAKGIQLSGNLDGSKAEILGHADFSGAKFEQPVIFGEAKLHGDVRFVNADFQHTVGFVFTEFGSKASFASAAFNDDVVFRNTKFLNDVDFPIVKFRGRVDFTEASFQSPLETGMPSIRFEGATFDKFTSFRHCKFVSEYPDFFGASLHERTGFTAINKYWPGLSQRDYRAAKDSCAIIRHSVAKQSLPEDEHFFFRREMYFAGQIGSWFDRLPYRVFGLVSDYGHSILRPAVGLGLLWIVPALIYTIAFEWMLIMDGKRAIALDGFGLSFANIFKFFGFQRTYYDIDDIQALHGLLQVMGAAQTVFGFIFLFFLGLGLRTRFRMR